ncbi:hypothetical protein UPYG_G00129900 [Umbra pygmaea]|uniref:Ig-like domain-containing protein n=1 Tax=Umbra pygmaea TaxID=75934 RepID=A0ABD0XA25_UMBPY
MAATLRGTVFTFLLLSFISQGFHSFEVFHHENVKAVVGQNISLPCILQKKKGATTSISQMEWRKKGEPEDHRLVVYHPTFGESRTATNVRLILEKDGQNTIGSFLIMKAVEKSDNGRYICEITAYPNGSIRKVTRLAVKDLNDIIKCSSNETIEAEYGQNVTVDCLADGFPNTTYTWTKDNKWISDEASLVLLSVTESYAGVYTLTVTVDDTELVKKMRFNIIMLSTTTKLDKTERITITQSDKAYTTYSPRNVTLSTWLLRTGSNISGPTYTSVNITRPSATRTSVTSETTEPGRGTRIGITTDTLTPFTMQELNSTVSMTTSVIRQINTTTDMSVGTEVGLNHSDVSGSTHNPTGVPSMDQSGSTYPSMDQSGSTYPSMDQSGSTYPSMVQSNNLTSDRGQGNSSKAQTSTVQELPVTTTLFPKKNTLAGAESATIISFCPDCNGNGVITAKGASSQRYVMVSVIIPFLALLILVGFLYRRHIIQKRMDMPPPFKPPPPPVKYSFLKSEDLPLTDIVI